MNGRGNGADGGERQETGHSLSRAGAAHAGRQLSDDVQHGPQVCVGVGRTAHGALHRPGTDRR